VTLFERAPTKAITLFSVTFEKDIWLDGVLRRLGRVLLKVENTHTGAHCLRCNDVGLLRHVAGPGGGETERLTLKYANAIA